MVKVNSLSGVVATGRDWSSGIHATGPFHSRPGYPQCKNRRIVLDLQPGSRRNCSDLLQGLLMGETFCLHGVVGVAGHKEVLLGFAPAGVLHALSFADVLDEDTGRGYQRRFNAPHSLDFRRYIQRAGTSTIPLTFNLRP